MDAPFDVCLCESLRGMRINGMLMNLKCPKCVCEIETSNKDLRQQVSDLLLSEDQLHCTIRSMMESDE